MPAVAVLRAWLSRRPQFAEIAADVVDQASGLRPGGIEDDQNATGDGVDAHLAHAAVGSQTIFEQARESGAITEEPHANPHAARHGGERNDDPGRPAVGA